MGRIVEVQSTYSSGEADPRLVERRDVQFYYSAASRMRNVVSQPQGGFTHAGGSWLQSPLRNPLTEIALTAGQLTAVNGGTVANLVDGDDATNLETAAVTDPLFEIVHVDLGTATAFVAVDLVRFQADAKKLQVVAVETSTDNVAWTRLAVRDIDVDWRSRRYATAPGASVNARYIRIVMDTGAGAGLVRLTSIKLWSENAVVGDCLHIPFKFNLDQQYTLVVTGDNIDVFDSDDVYQASIAAEISDAMISTITWAQKLDTLVLFHEDLETLHIKRQELDTEWNFEPYLMENVPLYDYGAVYTNGVNAKQKMQIFNGGTGDTFVLTLEGKSTSAITRDATSSVTASNIKTALEALESVDAGLTVTDTTSVEYLIEFTGGDNAGRAWLLMTVTANEPDRTYVVSEVQKGKQAGEAVISTSRGWARAGAFSQGRLVMAGLKALPLHILASVTEQHTDFNIDLGIATAAMLFQLDSDTADGIVALFAGSNLIVFTENEAYYNRNRVLSATEVPDFAKTDQIGIEPGVPVVSLEGGLVFIERGGNVVRELLYTEIKQTYKAGNISVLSAHLLNKPHHMTRRRAVTRSENEEILILNVDGSMIVMSSLRSENVTGYTLVEGRDPVKSMAVDDFGITRLVVLRTMAGITRNWLERIDRDLWLEGSTKVTGVNMTEATGLDQYEGETVRVLGDGSDEGLATVASGTVAVGSNTSEIIVGFDRFADVTDMPVYKDEEAKRPLARLKRTYALELSLFETTSCAVQVNGGDVYDLPLDQLSLAEFGKSIADYPYTGVVRLEGFLGFDENAHVRITQIRPGALTVMSVRKEVVV